MCVYEIFFSPTGGTKKVADILGNTFDEVIQVDLIKDKDIPLSFNEDDVCIFAVPSYGGRVPSVVVDMIKTMNGNHAKTLLVAVFGNRHIDDTLIELKDTLVESHFHCIAAIEAVAEHSLMHQFAKGRPDAHDKTALENFMKEVKNVLNKDIINEVRVPGVRPYKRYNGVPLKPKVNRKCTCCGLCARECPAHAIDLDNPKKLNTDQCISCMHCVSICPIGARTYSQILTQISAQKMKDVCSDRKENQLYI